MLFVRGTKCRQLVSLFYVLAKFHLRLLGQQQRAQLRVRPDTSATATIVAAEVTALSTFQSVE
ncbi:MAG: hypothetical protein ACI9HK_005603 [Pirellulaceae bacterium]|jgi:hypothetical protein